MRTKTKYEWDREATDEYGDIHEHHHGGKLEEVPSHEDVLDMVKEATNSKLVLIRDEFSSEDGDLLDRQWAYVTENKLPDEFNGGSKVPVRFHQELTKS